MLPIERYNESFLRNIFSIIDENSLPEMPCNFPPIFAWKNHSGYKPEKILKLWKESHKLNSNKPVVIYVHIPFCQYLCRFCGFYKKIPENTWEIELYLKMLEKEVFILKDSFLNIPVRSLCFGGGTPTLLNEKQLESLIYLFRNNFLITSETKIAMEASPQTLTLQKAKKLKELGVNYLAIGIQSFNERLMYSLGRPQTKAEAINAIKNAKKAGIENVEADLIVGLPGQNREIFKEDIKILSRFDLERVYIFDWQPRKYTSFNSHKASLEAKEMDTIRNWRREAINELIHKQNYIMRCGHWIYKRKGGEWPYTYDQQEDDIYSILGLGTTSITYCADRQRYQNVSDVNKYINYLSKGVLPINNLVFLNKKLEMINHIIVRLFHGGQFSISYFLKKYKVHPYKVFKKEIDFLVKNNILLKSYDTYLLVDRSISDFFVRGAFYPDYWIEKICKKIGVTPELKTNIKIKKDSIKDFENLKLCPLRENQKFEDILKVNKELLYRNETSIIREIKIKNEYGSADIIFFDSGYTSIDKIIFLSKISRKIGYKSISFMTPGLLISNKKFKLSILNNLLSEIYIYPSTNIFDLKTLNLLKQVKFTFSLIKNIDLNEIENAEKFISFSKKMGADKCVFFIPYNGNFNYLKLYEELSSIAKKLVLTSKKYNINVKILNIPPCILFPHHNKLWDFLAIKDTREGMRRIQLEICLTCKYLLYCPGPDKNYIKNLSIIRHNLIPNNSFPLIKPIENDKC